MYVGAPTWQSSQHPAVSSCCSCGGLGLAGPQTRGSRLGMVCGSSASSRHRLRLLGPWRERPPGPGSGQPAQSMSSRWKRRDWLQSGGQGGGGRGRQTPGHLWQRTPSRGDAWSTHMQRWSDLNCKCCKLSSVCDTLGVFLSPFWFIKAELPEWPLPLYQPNST